MSKLLDSIMSGLQAEIEASQRDIDADDHDSFPTHRQILDVYAFLIHWFVMAADKAGSKSSEEVIVASKPKRGKGATKPSRKAASNRDAETFTWTEQIIPTLALVGRLLRIKSHRIWLSTAERDTFINCLTQPVYHVMENEALMKIEDIRGEAYKVICLAVKNHGHAFGAQTSMIQCLQYFEHLAEPIAEILTLLKDQFDHTQLAEGILRMALIEIVGALIKDIAMEEETQVDANKKESRINAL
ncbi:hypothetical protein FRB90_010609, partial [Tulasnella sp. 427]